MTLSSLLGGIASASFSVYDFRDSWRQRSKLHAGAEKVEQQNEKLGQLDAEMQAEIGPSADHAVEKSYSRAKGAWINLCSAGCNGGTAVITVVTTSFQLAGDKSDTLKDVQGVATKVGYAFAGFSDFVNGGIQGSTCLSAIKNWWYEKDPQSSEMYGWHAINQGCQTVASWGRGASSFCTVAGYTADLDEVHMGKIAPGIIGALGAAALSLTSDYICKKKIAAAKQRDPTNPEVYRAALHTQVSHSKVETNIVSFVKQKLIQRPTIYTAPQSPPSAQSGGGSIVDQPSGGEAMSPNSLSPMGDSGLISLPMRDDDRSVVPDPIDDDLYAIGEEEVGKESPEAEARRLEIETTPSKPRADCEVPGCAIA